jgi:hypothetical protein
MAATTKNCPKCSKEMIWSQRVHVIPGLHHPLSDSDPVSTKAGFPVALLCCPDTDCRYVELYAHQM